MEHTMAFTATSLVNSMTVTTDGVYKVFEFVRGNRNTLNVALYLSYTKGAEDGIEIYIAHKVPKLVKFFKYPEIDDTSMHAQLIPMLASDDLTLPIPLPTSVEAIKVYVKCLGIAVPTGVLEMDCFDGNDSVPD
jgi:hypothetical protein